MRACGDGEMMADPTIAHTVLEYTVLLLFGGGGLLKGREVWRNRNGNDKLSGKIRQAVQNAINAEAVPRAILFKKHIGEAHEPLLKELRGMRNELHTYIEIQKDRDRRQHG